MSAIQKTTLVSILCLQVILYSCMTSSIYDLAVQKQGAAMYSFEQRDYKNVKQYCLEAQNLWIKLKNTKYKEIPKWVIDNNIRKCEQLLSLLPESQALERTVVKQIRIVKNQILVDTLINQTSKATLLIDTGATCSLLVPNFAKKLGILTEKDQKKYTVHLLGEKKVKMPFVSLEEMAIGEAAVKNLKIGIFSAFPDQPHIKGILGTDFLMHYKMTIDHEKGILKLDM